jgi:acyl transferase domain-containing protein/acyl carrier protein
MSDTEQHDGPDDDDGFEQIAVIGVAGRYPESPDVRAFWQNLRNGRDCLHTFSADEMGALGLPAKYHQRENFVPRGSELPDASCFDARFFGFTPQEAAVMDPQSRVFLETCWEALEDSGYDPHRVAESIGVFAGSNPNDYAALLGVADPSDSLTAFNQLIGSDKDFLATRVSHRLNLRGPALTLQTACSTSLVAIHLAVQSLLNFECTVALAGGVAVNLRQGVGYFAQPGMILSPAGTCRAFDAAAEGTTLGQGCGVAVLKRLSEAIADDDHIYAVVKASAINNDGAAKMSYTAPSEDGQAEVIALAHQLAGIESDTISYVEAHGTGTTLGDPVEIAALTRAFAPGTDRTQYCAIGSAKTNFGHTDAAAGITGFLKTVLSLHHGEIPPSLHFDTPNPSIGFESTPFYVNTELRPWERHGSPRRAGVSAFGIGGTNAHVILEEAPTRPLIKVATSVPMILPVSARSEETVAAATDRVRAFVQGVGPDDLADVAFTLREGRTRLRHRRALVVPRDGSEIGEVSAITFDSEPILVSLYTGQGAQYPGMTRGLVETEPVFAAAFDECIQRFEGLLGRPLRDLILGEDHGSGDDHPINQTSLTQPALFAVEHAVTALLRSWGVVPDIVIGHSIGEFAAAVEAGVFSLDDAIRLVVERGRLMQSMEPGSMASVQLDADVLAGRLPENVAIAAHNAPGLSVISGPDTAVAEMVERLAEDNVRAAVLRTSHAFHSAMMDDAAEAFEATLTTVKLRPPTKPVLSNVTGRWLQPNEATDPAFWAAQIRKPVLFADCVSTVMKDNHDVAFIEVGPGRGLATLTTRNDDVDPHTVAVATMVRHPETELADQVTARAGVARLWCAGRAIDWEALGQADGRRIPLPTYPFERIEHWAPERRHHLALPFFGEPSDAAVTVRNDEDTWLWAPTWSRLPDRPAPRDGRNNGTVLAFVPDTGGGSALAEDLLREHGRVICVEHGDVFADEGDRFVVRPGVDEDVAILVARSRDRGADIDTVVHAWTLDSGAGSTADAIDEELDLGVAAILSIARHLGPTGADVDLLIATHGTAQVYGDEPIVAANAALLGPARVAGLEFPSLRSRVVDLEAGLDDPMARRQLLDELTLDGGQRTHIARRQQARWVPDVSPLPPAAHSGTTRIRRGGHYLVVGGTGGVGLSIADHLAREYGARLSLTSRSGRPTGADGSSPEAQRRADALDIVEAQGHGLTVHVADATSPEAMASAVAVAEAEFGPIHGVISAVGVADGGGVIQRRTSEQMHDSITSKVHGSLVLADTFGDRDLDFIALSSSVAATLWHNRFGQVGYVTANAFVEAVAHQFPDLPVVTIAWDDWMDIGMSVRSAEDFARTYGDQVSLVDELNSFTPAEGVRMFERALESGQRVVVVSPTDLRDRIRDDVHEVSPFLAQATAAEIGGELDVAQGVEALVRSAWRDLLGYEDLLDTDDFFDLGGDSLQAARLADRLSRALDTDVPLQVVFNNSTLEGMAAAVEELSGTASAVDDIESEGEREEDRSAPLGPAQIRFLRRSNPNSDHFNIATILDAPIDVNPDVLESVIRSLVRSHPSLRTAHDTDAEVQVVLDADGWSGFEHLKVGQPDKVVEICERKQRSLSLSRGDVFTATLIDIESTGESRLFLVLHHFVSDRISLLLLIDSLSDIYTMATDRGLEPGGRRSVTHGQWVRTLQRIGSGKDGAAAASSLAALPWNDVPRLRTDESSPNRNSDGNAIRVDLDNDVSAALLHSEHGAADELILASLLRALASWTGSPAAAVEVLNHGRRLVDLDVARSVGFFLSYAPVVACRVDLEGPADAVRELRRQAEFNWLYDPLRLYEPGGNGSQIVELARPEVLFNYVGREIAAPEGQLFCPTNEARGEDVDAQGLRDHPIAVMAELKGDDRIELTFVYSSRLHTEAEIERLTALVTTDLVRWVRAPGDA